MNPSAPPPPGYQPPPPTGQAAPPSAIPKILIGLLICGVLFCIAMCAGGAYLVKTFVSGEPQPAEGFGKPTLVSQGSNGWATYDFKDLGMRVELPAEPEPDPPAFEAGDRLLYTKWALYTTSSEHLTVDFERWWYFMPDEDSPRSGMDDIGRATDWLGQTPRKSTFGQLQVGGISALQGRHIYKPDGLEEEWVLETLYVDAREWSVIINFDYSLKDSAAAAERDRILKSISWHSEVRRRSKDVPTNLSMAEPGRFAAL